MKETKDWGSIPFGYTPLRSRYEAVYKDGRWIENGLVGDAEIKLSESAVVFQYAQTCFEGLKAYRTEDGHIVIFRPDLNAKRFSDSCRRMLIPEISPEMFIRAIDMTVRANEDSVPPYGSGATLYIRPFAMGTSAALGVKPADEYVFRVFGSPVGAYFKDGVKPLTLTVSDFDRAAPHGTGDIKAGLNYAMSLYPGQLAHAAGFAENLYLDPATRTKVEETGGANLIFITHDNVFVTPKSSTILPSVTR
ncbi:MAG: branched-chain amino acid aminotransferase, partial [Oscillospiraceae bacterium]|nr:branched-chain amino acid aminotransferase [Oscillospiraceae bacterium]